MSEGREGRKGRFVGFIGDRVGWIGCCYRCFNVELGVRFGVGFGGVEEEVKIFSYHFCFFGRRC